MERLYGVKEGGSPAVPGLVSICGKYFICKVFVSACVTMRKVKSTYTNDIISFSILEEHY